MGRKEECRGMREREIGERGGDDVVDFLDRNYIRYFVWRPPPAC